MVVALTKFSGQLPIQSGWSSSSNDKVNCSTCSGKLDQFFHQITVKFVSDQAAVAVMYIWNSFILGGIIAIAQGVLPVFAIGTLYLAKLVKTVHLFHIIAS